MKTPEHLRAFDNYAVLVPGGVPGAGEDRWIEERSLAEAVRTAQTFCRANRRRTTIHHKRFGLVAAVRPIGQTSIVVWYLDPKYSKAIEVITWSVLVGGILIWLVTLSALA